MNAIELLKEAAQALETVQHYFPAQDEADKGLAVADVDACQRLAERIDTYLAALRESAMEVVDQLDHLINDNQGIRADFDHNKAAALIEDYGRRVPRAMLEEIYQEGYATGYTQPMRNTKSQDIERIAFNHGVQVEG